MGSFYRERWSREQASATSSIRVMFLGHRWMKPTSNHLLIHGKDLVTCMKAPLRWWNAGGAKWRVGQPRAGVGRPHFLVPGPSSIF